MMNNKELQLLKDDPIKFFEFCWKDVVIWDKLEEIVRSVQNHKRTTVRSGHGVGKSWLMARIALWFLMTHRPAKVITTAPTWPQVEKILWGELRDAISKSRAEFGGRLLQTEYHIRDDTFAVGLSTTEGVASREYGATKLQGYHSPNLLVILDEGAGVAPEIWTSATSLITGENNKIVAIGNPASPSGPFYDTFTSPIWNKIHISCYDHPNIKEQKVLIPGCVTQEWVDERVIEWGGLSLFEAKVLGNFPDEGEDTLFPLSFVEAAVEREVPDARYVDFGVDVARFGDDETICYSRKGEKYKLEFVMKKRATTEVSGAITKLYKDTEYARALAVDDTGVGGGVTDICRENNLPTRGLNFGEKARESEKFFNLKAEIFWNLAQEFRNGTISIPNDPILISQLTSIKFSYTSKEQIKIEGKDEMKKRGLKSPDRADALVICYMAGRGSGTRLQQETDKGSVTRGLREMNF